MKILEAKKIWKEYGDQVVIEQLSVDVDKGEFVTIVGASGCGKTTFLKMLLGTEQATRGELLLNGEPIPTEPTVERGVVFQRYSVFPHKTVLQNVAIGQEFEASPFLGKAIGHTRRKIFNDAKEMLTMVGLQSSFNKYPHELSGGMQQRLAIAQALMKKPSILLLDEPFGALDPGITNDMHELTTKLWREHQLTIFMITHDIKEGFELGNRLWVFDKTRVDPQMPERFGATITYDLRLDKESADEKQKQYQEIINQFDS